jgi:hypothetical protein
MGIFFVLCTVPNVFQSLVLFCFFCLPYLHRKEDVVYNDKGLLHCAKGFILYIHFLFCLFIYLLWVLLKQSAWLSFWCWLQDYMVSNLKMRDKRRGSISFFM